MKRERVIELFEEAQHEAGDMHAVFRFAQMIEQETLERAAEKLATQHDMACKRNKGVIPAGYALVPIEGDLLPVLGSRVYIRHARDDLAHACTVTGYYAWGDLGGNPRLHRVSVRLAYEVGGISQSRMLCDCYPTEQAALAAAPAPSQQKREHRLECEQALQLVLALKETCDL